MGTLGMQVTLLKKHQLRSKISLPVQACCPKSRSNKSLFFIPPASLPSCPLSDLCVLLNIHSPTSKLTLLADTQKLRSKLDFLAYSCSLDLTRMFKNEYAGSQGPTHLCWTTNERFRERKSFLQLYTHRWAYQAPEDNSKYTVTQTALVALKGWSGAATLNNPPRKTWVSSRCVQLRRVRSGWEGEERLSLGKAVIYYKTLWNCQETNEF